MSSKSNTSIDEIDVKRTSGLSADVAMYPWTFSCYSGSRLAANHFALAGVVFGLLDPYADSDNTKIVQCSVLMFLYSYKSRMKDFQNKYE